MSRTAFHADIITRNSSVPEKEIPTLCTVKEKVAKTRRKYNGSVKGLSNIRNSNLGTLTAVYCRVILDTT